MICDTGFLATREINTYSRQSLNRRRQQAGPIQDYVHVSDLADAHVAALECLAAGSSGSSFNLGNGRGFSVAEVIHTTEKVTGLAIKTELSPRRSGDPAVLLSDSTKAQ